MLLIREDLNSYSQFTPQQMQEDIERHVRWVEELVSKGQFKDGQPLAPEGMHIKPGSKLVTDGPYIEAKEGISGYFILLANSLQEAVTIAQGCPALDSGASVEVREILQSEG